MPQGELLVVLLVSFLFNGFVNGIQPHLQATTLVSLLTV